MTDLDFDFLTFAEGTESLAFDGRVMDKYIALLGLDEAETFAVVKPLDCTFGHMPVSFPKASRERRSAGTPNVFLTPTSYGLLNSPALKGILLYIIPEFVQKATPRAHRRRASEEISLACICRRAPLTEGSGTTLRASRARLVGS